MKFGTLFVIKKNIIGSKFRIMFTVGNVDRYIDRYIGQRRGRQ